MSRDLTPEQSLLVRRAERLVAESKVRRLGTVGTVIPEGWDRIVEGAYPAIWPAYRVALPAGWIDLVFAISQQIGELCPGASVADSKEKYGGLRVDIAPVSDDSMLLETIYESMSQQVCQDCGEAGTPRTDRGWWATLCDTHAATRDQR